MRVLHQAWLSTHSPWWAGRGRETTTFPLSEANLCGSFLGPLLGDFPLRPADTAASGIPSRF